VYRAERRKYVQTCLEFVKVAPIGRIKGKHETNKSTGRQTSSQNFGDY